MPATEMNPPATTSLAPPQETRPTREGSFLRQVLRSLSSPARFIYRRPGRAVLLLGIFLLTCCVIAAVGLWIWFESHLRSARNDLAKGHNSEAVRHLRACQRVRPEQREVLLLSARAARRAGSWDEADSMLNTYWQRYGDEEPLVFERLLHRAARGEVESVGSSLRAHIQQGGDEARLAREALVVGLISRFRWVEARTFLEEWLAETPDDTLPLLQMGKFQEQLLNIDEATRIYRRVLELDPDQLEARLRLATILVMRRLSEEAATELAILKEKLPNHAEVQVLWARALSLLGRTEDARRAIEECLRAYPDYPAALLERGNNALIDGNEIEAEQYLARAVRLDPGNILIHNQYALVLGRNGKQAQVAAEYAKAHQLQTDGERISQIIRGPLQDNPNDPALHHEIGTIALRSGLVTEAIRWFTSALQVDPDHLPTHRVLANIYRELDNPALAAKHRAIAQKLSLQQGKH